MPKCVELAGAFQKLRASKVGIYGVTPRYLINIHKVAEETEMAYFADFLALYLSPFPAPKAIFAPQCGTEIVGDLLNQNMPKSKF